MKLFLIFSVLLVVVSCQCPTEIDVQSVLFHLRQLDLVAGVNNGNRAAGTSGYQASMGYIISQLQNSSLSVTVQDFTFTAFTVVGDPMFSQTAPTPVDFIYQTDYRILTGSGSGSAVSDIVHIVSNLGCHTADYANFPPGAVAVIARGDCSFTEKADHAAAAGAAAAIIYNNPVGPIFSGSVEANIPVLSVSNTLGRSFTASTTFSYNIQTLKVVSVTSNILAETASAQTDSVVVVGSHLDSVPEGAGINDNGSGSAVNLELALTLSQCLRNPINKVRFAWWGAEELGLLGSRHYVDNLVKNDPAGLSKIILNLNYDMVGSPNFFYGIYNGSGADEKIRQRSVLVQNQFESAITRQNKIYDLTPFSGRSDYGPFIENGVAAGGLFSGAEEVKDAAGRSKFKGLANTAYDPCYHDYCDSFENINVEGLTTLANAAYTVTNYFVSSYRATEPSPPHRKSHIQNTHPNAISPY